MNEPADDLPRRFSGQLDIPSPLRPLWFERDPETLRRVRDGLINLPDHKLPAPDAADAGENTHPMRSEEQGT